MATKSDIEALVEDLIYRLDRPLHDPLEDGFRHSPLTHREAYFRMSKCIVFAHEDLLTLQKMLKELES